MADVAGNAVTAVRNRELMRETGRCPRRGAVTILAGVRDADVGMVRRALVVGGVAEVAVLRQSRVGAARMALRAG